MEAADPVRRAARDEQRVLDELACLQRELEETRRRRRQATDAFNAFLSAFSLRGDAVHASPPGSGERARAGTRTSRDPLAGASVQPRAHQAVLDRPRRASSARRALLVAAATATVGAALWFVPRGRVEAPVVPQELPPAAVSAPAVDTQQAAPPAAELTTLRPVWMRVVVDGQRILERELPAGARVPLAGESIVVRAGDAGAVRLLRHGRDQGLLGADGAVVTRTFLVVPH